MNHRLRRTSIAFVCAAALLVFSDAALAPLAHADADKDAACPVRPDGRSHILRGHVRDRANRESLVAATIIVTGVELVQEIILLSDENGRFEVTLGTGCYFVTIYYGDSEFTYREILR